MADYNSTLPILGSVAIASSSLVGVSGLIFTDGNMTGSMATKGIGSVIVQSSNLIGVSGAIFDSGDITGSVVISSSPLLGVSGLIFTDGKMTGSMAMKGIGSVIIHSSTRVGVSGIVEIDGTVSTTAGERSGIVQAYKTSASVAASAIGSHSFVSLGSLFVTRILGGFSGKAKVMVLESGNTAIPLATGFNSTANPNINLDFGENNGLYFGNGSRCVLTITNRDSAAQDIYSTIIGYHTHIA